MNIANYDKAEVLAALYNRAKVQGIGVFRQPNGNMSKDEAQAILDADQKNDRTPYFDYLNGRVMKVNLARDEVQTALYNRDNGIDAAETVLSLLSPSSEEELL